jgi:hypothetical protein
MLVGSLFFVDQAATMSVGIGVAIAIANFWLLERLVNALVGKKKINLRRLILIFIAKVAVLFGVLGFVVLKVPLEAFAFLLGLSCIVLGIMIEGVTDLFGGSQSSTEEGGLGS